MPNRTLPPWTPDMSDGCTALPVGPLALRRRFNRWFFRRQRGATRACSLHDGAYYYGGSAADRLEADDALVRRWEASGVPRLTRWSAYRATRLCGGPRWRTPGVSWANGGQVFRYTDAPARPEGTGG